MLNYKKFNDNKTYSNKKNFSVLYDYLINKFFNIELFFEKTYNVKKSQSSLNGIISSYKIQKCKKITGSNCIQHRLLYDDTPLNIQVLLELKNDNTGIFKEISFELKLQEFKESFITKYYDLYISMTYRFTIIKLLKLKELIILKKDIFFYDDYINIPFEGRYFNFRIKSPFFQEIINIDNQINFLGGKNFEIPLVMSEKEEVNGYNLYNLSGENIINYDTFIDYLKIWNNINLNVLNSIKDLPIPSVILSIIVEYNDMNDEEFTERFEKNACSDWNKQDKYGESYVGYWNSSEDSYLFKNAYNLTREDNLKSLLELPYPREFILETITIGCNNRLESVRYSNFLCEWMKRKIEIMFNISV